MTVHSISTEEKQKQDQETRRGVFKTLLQVGLFIFISVVTYFLCAGRLTLPIAWIYMIMILVSTVITSFLMKPDLIAERSGFKEGTKTWDVIPTIILGRIGPLVILIVAGLDERFGWSPDIPVFLPIVSLGIAIIGLLITDWAVITNNFFSGVVRIQKDRGQIVVTNGPYRFVRHPGYLGAILFNIATPLILSSCWAFIPAVVVLVVTVIRTVLEDRTLQEELEGYKAYTKKVRYRLVPKIW